MDNLENKNKRNANSPGKSGRRRPDPIVQARDDSNRAHEEMQPTEIVPSAKKPISVADATLLPNQFMGAGGAAQAVPLADNIIESMLRFKWMILAIFILVAAPAIAAIWTQILPKYRAKAEVRVRPIIPRLVFRTDENGMIPLYDSFVNTQVSIVRSPTVLQRVLDQQEVRQTQWYKKPEKPLRQRLHGNTATPMERLRDTLSVSPRRRTEIIDVSFLASAAKEAKLIVDTVLEEYIKYIMETSDDTEKKLYRELTDQYTSLQAQIQGREMTSAELRKSLGTATPQELISSKRIRLDETKARLSELQQGIAVLQWEMKQAITDDSNDVPVAPAGGMEKQPKYHEDAEWRRLDIDVSTIRHNIDNGVLAPKHPDMARLTKELEFAEELLRRREAQLDEQWRDRPKNWAGVPTTVAGAGGLGVAGLPMTITGAGGLGAAGAPIAIIGASGLSDEERLTFLEHQLGQAQQAEQLLLDEIDKQQTEFDELFQVAQSLENENNELLHRRELFSAVRQRLDQKEMERNLPIGSIEVLTRALVSSQPYNDRRVVFTAMALFMALGMGGGAAFLRASRSQAIYTPKDMPHPMQVPFLGHVPLIRTKRAPGRALRDEIEQNRFLLVESIRVMRTALLSRLDGRGSSTVLITSATTGTGKSSFTKILGKSMAQAGMKVLMIDADFRKMAMSKSFDLLDRPGFMDSLSRRSVDKRHIFPTETSGLSIMPVGKRGSDDVAFEQIANGAFKTCMGQLSEQYNYDIILLDSSPILPVADATILAGQVDGTIMVERELVSRRADVANALIRLGSAGGHLFGTVFVGSGDRKNYGYNYHYSGTSGS